MPRTYNLGDYDERLKGVYIIVGEGLCSNVYVIRGDETVIVDTGVGNHANSLWPKLEELGVEPTKLKSVVLTHAHHDHAMGTFLILQRANPRVFLHERDARFITSHLGPNLVKVEDNDTIETELWPLKVIWTPGHTEGGMCLHNAKEKLLFSGDTVFPDGNFGNYHGESGSLKEMIGSLKRLSELDLDIILPGHGSPIFTCATEHIKLSLERASDRAKGY